MNKRSCVSPKIVTQLDARHLSVHIFAARLMQDICQYIFTVSAYKSKEQQHLESNPSTWTTTEHASDAMRPRTYCQAEFPSMKTTEKELYKL